MDKNHHLNGFRVKNLSGEVIPKGACVELVPLTYDDPTVGQTTNLGFTYFGCDKPSGNGPYAFTVAETSVDGYPVVHIPSVVPIECLLNDYADLTEAWSEGLDPVAGQWYLEPGSTFKFGGYYETEPTRGFVLDQLGSRDTLVRITETDPYDDVAETYAERPIAVYRDTGTVEVTRVRATECGAYELNGDAFEVHTDRMRGVHYTNCPPIKVVREAGCWQIDSYGDDFWGEAITLESIAADATGQVELWADGPIVTARSDTSIALGTLCDVDFDDQAQEFKITAQRCQPEE